MLIKKAMGVNQNSSKLENCVKLNDVQKKQVQLPKCFKAMLQSLQY